MKRASTTATAIKAKRTFSDEAILGGSLELWAFEGELEELPKPASASRGKEFAGKVLVSSCGEISSLLPLSASTCLLASWRWGCIAVTC